MIDWFYEDAPIGLIAFIVGSLLLGSAGLGQLVRRQLPVERTEEEKVGEQLIVSAMIGLLGLLLGFTFALAIDRFDARRTLVLEEANAIRTTWLRAQILDEPHRSRISGLLQAYAENRIRVATEEDRTARLAQLIRGEAIQHALWRETATAIRPMRDVDYSSVFVQGMNDTIDVGAARKAARRAHVPPRVLSILLIYMCVSAYAIGHVMLGVRMKWVAAVLLLLITTSYLLILDIDNATRGAIRELQYPMEDLLANMRAHPPASFGP